MDNLQGEDSIDSVDEDGFSIFPGCLGQWTNRNTTNSNN